MPGSDAEQHVAPVLTELQDCWGGRQENRQLQSHVVSTRMQGIIGVLEKFLKDVALGWP